MSAATSALYSGHVTHRRTRPRPHRLDYRVFSLLLDLDELDTLAGRLRLFARNRFAIFSFHDRDHGDGSATPLRTQVERHLRDAGLACEGGAIRLLALPRILGYAFNPLSVYFCHRPGGALAAILYEVNNTFGQRHSYMLPVAEPGPRIRQDCAKRFYVSPFQDMAMTYVFRVIPPCERLVVSIVGRDAEGPAIAAVLSGHRKPLTDRSLAGAFVAIPFLNLKIIAGIHWEALLIWLKGGRLRQRPPPPIEPVTIHPVASQLWDA